jgi:hypothetical protein
MALIKKHSGKIIIFLFLFLGAILMATAPIKTGPQFIVGCILLSWGIICALLTLTLYFDEKYPME